MPNRDRKKEKTIQDDLNVCLLNLQRVKLY